MDSLILDLRYAVLTLLRSPGFTIAAVLCFALGIGANTVMFGVVDTLLLRPPAGVREPGRLARLYFTEHLRRGDATWNATSYPAYAHLRDDVPGFAGVTAYFADSLSVGPASEAEKIPAAMVTGTYFRTLGVAPVLGRFFGPDDDVPGGPPVAVLSYGYWRSRFGGDSGAIGRTLWVGGSPHAVVAVAPRGFIGPDLAPVDLWVPLAVAAPRLFAPDALTSKDDIWLQVLARLDAGTDPRQAAVEATAVYRREGARGGWATAEGRVALWPIQGDRGPESSRAARVSTWLAIVAALVLLIACANVANLLLVRGTRRRREIAVRLALGAGCTRLARQLLAESLVLAGLGAGAGLLVAVWGAPIVRRLTLPADAAAGSVLDARVLAFTAAVAVAVGLLSGLVPALRAGRLDLGPSLKTGQREGMQQRSGIRTGLLVAQVAVTLVLMVGAGLFVRSLRNVLDVNLGLDTRRVLAVSLDFRGARLTQGEIAATQWRLLERARSYPGVENAAAAMGGSFGSWSFGAKVTVPGRDSIPALVTMSPYLNAVTPSFFATTGTRIVRGRGLTAADGVPRFGVAVIGETMARLVWPNEDPLGQCFVFDVGKHCTRVVGVAADVHRQEIVEEPQLQFYVPLAQGDAQAMPSVLYLRTAGDARSLAPGVRRDLQRLSGDGIAVSVTPIENLVDTQLQPWRLGAAMCGAFGALALALAAFGLYAVLAYAVSQRRQEMGVRLALGAESRDLARLVIGHGLRVAAAGVAVGLAAALALGRLVTSLLYGVSPRDPLSLLLAALAVIGVAALASWLPARRAARSDPMEALRSE